MNRGILYFILILLFWYAASSPFSIRIVHATTSFYIRADGTVEGTDKLHREGRVYTLTSNLSGGIIVQKDNLLIDGNRYTLQGGGVGTGLDLTGRTNVTIRRIKVRNFLYGILFYSSSNNNLSDTQVAENVYGVRLNHSANNTLSENVVCDSLFGIWLSASPDNAIVKNNVTKNENDGIWLSGSSDNNLISNNNVKMNGYGIRIDDYSNNVFIKNDIGGNDYNIGVFSSLLPEFTQDIDTSNLVDGKPVYYLVNQHDMVVPSNAGWVALVNCTNITVKNLNLTTNGQGILMAYTTNSTITRNNITGNIHGLYLSHSPNNTFKENNIIESIASGIYLYYSPNNYFLSNLLNNPQQVYTVGSSDRCFNDEVSNNMNHYEPRNSVVAPLYTPVTWYASYDLQKNMNKFLPNLNFPTWKLMLFLSIVSTVITSLYHKYVQNSSNSHSRDNPST